jgi:polyisoprenoid-binding protein YceI
MKLTFGGIGLVIGLASVGMATVQTQEAPRPRQEGAAGRGAPAAPAGPPTPIKLEITEGTHARYRVAEQLVGISFGSDAVGTTEAVTGTVVLAADGSIDTRQSKIVVDLKTLKSDQQLRDQYIQRVTLLSEKFPLLEFAPRQAVGLPFPLPAPARPVAVAYQLTGDLTLHGITKPATWNVVATVTADVMSGLARTALSFAAFGMERPKVPYVLSVEDKIDLEVEFRCKRTAL